MIGAAFQRFRAWRKARYWRARQVGHLLGLLQDDTRWMAHSPIAAALTARYLAALEPYWYTRNFEDVSALRDRLGLDPRRPPAIIEVSDELLLYCRKHGKTLHSECTECHRYIDARIAYADECERMRLLAARRADWSRCKAAGGGARCVSHCGDAGCLGASGGADHG